MLKKIFSVLFLVVIATAGAIYYINHKEDFHLITAISISALTALSCLLIIISLCYGLQLKILLDHYQLNINFLQSYGISRASSLINLFLPFGGGASLKAIYLKKIHQLKYSSFIASMGITNVIKIMMNALFALLLLVSAGGVINTYLFSIAGLIFLATLLFLTLGHRLRRLDITSSGYIKNVMDEWQKIKQDRSTIKKLAYLGLFVFVLSSVNTYLSFQAFSVHISASASGTITAFSTITGLLNLIPGNLGIREAIIIIISNIHGVGINESVHAAALSRILQIIWTFILTPFFTYNFSDMKKRSAG